MAYASMQDIVELYGPSALYVADRDNDGTADGDAVARALSLASDEIDSYVGVRYGLPLPAVPGILRQHCVDIAVYRLALSADVLTVELRRRYDDAVAHLRLISKGDATLVLPADPNAPADPDDTPGSNSPRPIVVEGPPRLFTRDAMREF